jgi:hypothetical protein
MRDLSTVHVALIIIIIFIKNLYYSKVFILVHFFRLKIFNRLYHVFFNDPMTMDISFMFI